MNDAIHKHIADHFGRRDDKEFKTTLFQSPQILLGVNCLEPGQAQSVHTHGAADKFYAVMEGSGWFTVGDVSFEAGPGDVVWARAGLPHGVLNKGGARLALLVGIAPAPPAK
jgi:mannose-6-phosphate isomerase-like protein (cupin superfamily)